MTPLSSPRLKLQVFGKHSLKTKKSCKKKSKNRENIRKKGDTDMKKTKIKITKNSKIGRKMCFL